MMIKIFLLVILRGELPAFKVYEDDQVLAFMDVMPQAEGHTLVIPKTPAVTLLDLRSSKRLLIPFQVAAKSCESYGKSLRRERHRIDAVVWRMLRVKLFRMYIST